MLQGMIFAESHGEKAKGFGVINFLMQLFSGAPSGPGNSEV